MVDDGRRTTDGRTPDHGHPISSPCEPDGSGELKRGIVSSESKDTDQLPDHPTVDVHLSFCTCKGQIFI